MRALVISDTHFGAWTGEDLLREQENLDLLEPHLDVDEVVVLGDLFDLLFSSLSDAFAAATGLLDLLARRLQGRRLVLVPGNHDHHLVSQQAESLLELQLAGGGSPDRLRRELRDIDAFCRLLDKRLSGVEVELRYPTYMCGGVLCTHGHYLDLHARRLGSRPDRFLAHALWSIAVGARHAPTIEDYEATTALLTGLLYTVAQLPNGTHAERRAYRMFRTLSRAVRLSALPARALDSLVHLARALASADGAARRDPLEHDQRAYRGALSREEERQQRTGAPAGGEAASFTFARRIRPSDPTPAAVDAFERVVTDLGWNQQSDKIVFAHTHQPLDGVLGPTGACRYWNTGSWIYEPDLSSPQAYEAYLRNAWPGTAVLIDTAEPQPRLLRLREHLNPLDRAHPEPAA